MTGLAAQVEAAIERGGWSAALELLDAAGDAAGTPAMLELRAQAAYGCGAFEASIAAWEDQHALLCVSGELVRAGNASVLARRLSGGRVLGRVWVGAVCCSPCRGSCRFAS